MTPDQVKLVQQSFSKVAPISDQAAILFYDRLFEVAPEVKSMFPADMTEQRKKLMATLAVVVNGLGDLDRSCRRRAHSPNATSPTAPSPSIIRWSAQPAVDAGKGLGRRLDSRSRKRVDHGLRHVVRFHDFRGLWPPTGGRIREDYMSESLVIVGNGMAAARLVDELAKVALGRYAIAVIGDEPRLAYNRVLLSSVLAGEIASHEIELKPANWWRDRGVTLKYGCAVDRGRRRPPRTQDRQRGKRQFSKLVLATGSNPFGSTCRHRATGVHTFRDSRDVDLLLTLAAAKKRVVVVGGGLLGLEAAYGLAKAGAPVALLHLMDRLMERQLDARRRELLKSLVEQRASRSCSTPAPSASSARRSAEGVELKDGQRIEADAVILAAGIRPNIALAREAGIPVNRGIIVNDRLQTGSTASLRSANAPNIAASATAWSSRPMSRRGCWRDISPARNAANGGSVTATNLKVSGVGVFSAGEFLGAIAAKPSCSAISDAASTKSS